MTRQIHRPCKGGFTLVEMLVVISIIAILAALLLPAVTAAITRARNAAIAMEIKQIENAIEAYRLEKGDYPPNFRNPDVVRRHIAKCYPRINPIYFQAFMATVFPGGTIPAPPNAGVGGGIQIDEAESLVFWLSSTDKNPQYPFLSLKAATAAYATLTSQAMAQALPPPDPKVFYDFDQTRLAQTPATVLGTDVASFTAKYCKDTFYIYIDSRSYFMPIPTTPPTDLARFTADGVATYAYADDNQTGVRPYWSNVPATNVPSIIVLPHRDSFKPANPTTFQIICAGQDGDFGFSLTDTDVKVAYGNANPTIPAMAMIGTNFADGDKDNITNFSGGRRLGDIIP